MTLNFGNNLFPPRREFIKSFDFIDSVTGQGFITYYTGTAFNDTATEIKIIHNSTFISKSTTQTNSTDTKNASFVKVGDDDYDTKAGTTLVIEGVAITQIKFDVIATNAGGSIDDANTTAQGYAIIKIRKWDGSAETEIGSGKTETLEAVETGTTAVTTTNATNTLIIDCTRTRFKKGDVIRVTVESWIALPSKRFAETSCTGGLKYYTEPTNSTNLLKSAIPFDLEI